MRGKERNGRRIAILGVGNPILGDDGAGPRALEIIKGELGGGVRHLGNVYVELKEVCSGNLGLMEELIGFDEAIIIDSISAGPGIEEGEIIELAPEDLRAGGEPLNAHAADFASSYGLYRSILESSMPSKVKIYAIAIRDPEGFCDRLSQKAEAAAHAVASRILRELFNGRAE